MKYQCDSPGLQGDFVEFSDSWSRAQTKATWAAWGAIPTAPAGGPPVSDEEANAAEERLLATLRPKIISLHLTCPDAEPITNPAELTPARTEQMDQRVYLWWVNVWLVHLRDLANLGNALGRRLFDTSEASQPAKATPKTTVQPVAHRSRKR